MEYRPVMLGKIHTVRGWKAFSGFLRMSCGGCSRHRQGAARCPRLPKRLPRTPYPAALLNFSFCRHGSLDKPRGARYAMHRHHPPGGCHDRAERTSDGIGSSLERVYCPDGHIANAGIPPAQAPRQRKSADTASPRKRARDRSARMAREWCMGHVAQAGMPQRQAYRRNRHAIQANAGGRAARGMRLYARRRTLLAAALCQPRGAFREACTRRSIGLAAGARLPDIGKRGDRAAPSLSGKRRTR